MTILTSRITGPRDDRPLGPLDPRDHGWRTDLAELSLAPLVAVPHYAEPVPMVLTAASAPLLARADAASTAVSELLHGEGFAMLDVHDGFAWGYGLHDGYVGHLPRHWLAPAEAALPMMIGPGDALLFREPVLRAPVLAVLPAGARVAVEPADGPFLRLTHGPHAGAFVHERHLLAGGGDPSLDWVAVAERFVGAPYRWGGRSRAGIDCSGLVQVARMIAGRPTRRDSDMQAADAPTVVARADARRGDIACWPGHIGILLDAGRLLHANAWWMETRVEPLDAVIARVADGRAEPEIRRWQD